MASRHWRHSKMEILLFKSPHGRFLNTFVDIRGTHKLDVILWLHQINFYSAREHSRVCVSIQMEASTFLTYDNGNNFIYTHSDYPRARVTRA